MRISCEPCFVVNWVPVYLKDTQWFFVRNLTRQFHVVSLLHNDVWCSINYETRILSPVTLQRNFLSIPACNYNDVNDLQKNVIFPYHWLDPLHFLTFYRTVLLALLSYFSSNQAMKTKFAVDIDDNSRSQAITDYDNFKDGCPYKLLRGVMRFMCCVICSH